MPPATSPFSASTTGSVTPATTWAFVTMRPGATTNPVPDWLCPHATALPVTRTTDWAAALSAAEPVSTCGISGGSPVSASVIRGRPSSTTIDRSWASQACTGSGVTLSITRMTVDPATARDRNGTPSWMTLNASTDATSDATANVTRPPTSRSSALSGDLRIPRRMPRPTATPSACPIPTSTSATAMVANGRSPGNGTHSATSGAAKNAATTPANAPMITARLPSSP